MVATNFEEMDFFEKTGYVFTLIKPSWEAFKLNWTTFVLLWLTPALLALMLIPLFILPSVIDSTLWNVTTVTLAVVGVFVALFVLLLLWPAITIAQLSSVKGNKISVENALNESKSLILKFIAAAILIFLIAFGPMLLVFPLIFLIIGIFLLPFAFVWALVAPFFLSLTPYIIITEKLGPADALKRSFDLVKANWQWVLAAFVVLLALNVASNILSIIPPVGFIVGVGLSVAYFCMPAYVFLNHIDTNLKTGKAKKASDSPLAKKESVKKPAKKSSSKK